MWLQKSIPWHRMLTRRLSASVKLVGPVISCEGAPFKGKENNKWKLNPAVQSYAVALDHVPPPPLSPLHQSLPYCLFTQAR